MAETAPRDFPQQVVIETTAACNQDCIFCGRTYMQRPKKTMTAETFEKIVTEIGRESPDTEIWPTFMGEAMLLGKKLFDWIALARRAGCRKITLNTNGTKLTEANARAILECGIDRFIISCDAHTPETHALVRPGKHTKGLTGVYAGALFLIEEMKRTNRTWPLIEMQFSIFDENQHEVDEFRRYWLDQGVIVKVRPKVHWSGTVEGSARSTEPRTPCLWSLDTAAIHWNGSVVMCAIDCDGKYVAGSVQMQTLKEIWNGPLRWLRELQLAGRFKELPSVCRECPDWKVKRAQVFFPDESSRVHYEEYVRRGRTFTPAHFWDIAGAPA